LAIASRAFEREPNARLEITPPLEVFAQTPPASPAAGARRIDRARDDLVKGFSPDRQPDRKL